MATPLTMRIAVLAKGLPMGASLIDIAKRFDITEQQAGEAVHRILRNTTRYVSEWDGHPGTQPPRLVIHRINPTVERRNATMAQPIKATPVPRERNDRRKVLRYASIAEAAATGWTRSSIWRALKTGNPYAGYTWERDGEMRVMYTVNGHEV